ncbi:hypothetical protein AcidC75_34380 [Acidisoma sp. C75]
MRVEIDRAEAGEMRAFANTGESRRQHPVAGPLQEWAQQIERPSSMERAGDKQKESHRRSSWLKVAG